MESKITSVRENPLLERREVELELNHESEATPSEEDVKSRFAAEQNLDEEEIEVESIHTGFGKNTSVSTLKVYQEFEYDEDLAEEAIEESEEQETEVSEEYDDMVQGTITEVKEALEEMDEPDYEAALEAEKANKNRTTLIDWLEGQ